MEKDQKIFPQNQDKLGMRAEASEACMRGARRHDGYRGVDGGSREGIWQEELASA